jgi:glycine cleavage system H lipoate-binding protein
MRQELAMECPFLRHAMVKFCQVSAYRKMILESASDPSAERCSSPRYADCPAAAARLGNLPPAEHCPFLQESEVEFCGGAPVTKYIPAAETLLSRCESDGHFYCDLYLVHADPLGDRIQDGPIRVPEHLFYAPNHLWLDVAADGLCHIGIDGFLARVIGTADQISFVTTRGSDRAVAVVTAHGVDLPLVFPNPLSGIAPNFYLRTTPSKLTADPYGTGWMFEGIDRDETARAGLIPGDKAAPWIEEETRRLNDFVHELAARVGEEGTVVMADGGQAVEGIAGQLERGDLINLLQTFFAPDARWRRN